MHLVQQAYGIAHGVPNSVPCVLAEVGAWRFAKPLYDLGCDDGVIEVVTDVTERKEMEARVIHSEKLATTGEMAAVIAHEMRNSLTSVKMILQLELEREDLSDPDREALGVAANSVRRMETVVTDPVGSERLGIALNVRVRKYFSKEEMVKKTLRLYEY